MSKRFDADIPSPLALELFQPKPNDLYSLDATAHLAGVPRRSTLIDCRAVPVNHLYRVCLDFVEACVSGQLRCGLTTLLGGLGD